jgi:hypothetical protein
MSGAGQSRELVRLAAMPRRGKGKGDDEFRITVDEYTPDNGRPSQYVSLRVWWVGREGEWLPGKAGITIRRGELANVIAALQRAERILDGKESIREDPRQTKIPGADRTADMEGF